MHTILTRRLAEALRGEMRGLAGKVALAHAALLAAYLLYLIFRWGGEEYFTLVCDVAMIPLALGVFLRLVSRRRTV